MIIAYDIERVAVGCEQILAAIDAAEEHKLPDWLAQRLSIVRSECRGLNDAIKNFVAGGSQVRQEIASREGDAG